MEQIRNITAAEEQELWDYDNAPSKQAPCFDDQTKRIHSLQTQGLLTWENLLTPEECLALRVEIDKQMEIAKDEVICGEADFMERFGACIGRKNRCDVLLPLEGIILDAVKKILLQVSEVVSEVVGENATICELSALISDPGAAAQQVHHDTKFDEYPQRISLLCALQDVTEDMGPTILWPETNTREWHDLFKERGEDLEELLEGEHVRATMKAGCALLYDTNLLHCGGENRSKERRTLLVISSQEEMSIGNDLNTHIRSGIRGRFPINDIKNWRV